MFQQTLKLRKNEVKSKIIKCQYFFDYLCNWSVNGGTAFLNLVGLGKLANS